MIENIFSLIGVVLAVVGFVCMAFGIPMLIYFTIQTGRHKRDVPTSWHDSWGLNRNNLIFFPSLLDEEGQQYRKRALWAGKLTLLGTLSGVIAMFVLGKFAADALV